jgi:hypothetical protein
MAKEKVVTILITLFWLFAIPFAFAQNITDFKRVTSTYEYKAQGDVIYCQIKHGQLSIQIAIHDEVCDFTCWSMSRFTMNDKPISEWIMDGTDDPQNELNLFYSESAKAYCVVYEQYVEEYQAFSLYYISGDKFMDDGYFDPDLEQANKYYINNWLTNQHIMSVARNNNKPSLSFIDRTGKTLLEFHKFVRTEPLTDHNTYVDPVLKVKAPAFNWKSGFVPTTKYKKTFDLNADGEPEMYNIDWSKKEITYGNTDAMWLLKDKNAKNYIRFSGDTLLVATPVYKGTDVKTYTYYFLLSKKYNTASLIKYRYATHTSRKGNKGVPETICNFEEDFYPTNANDLYALERFELSGDYAFYHDNFRRKFTLQGLLKRLSAKGSPGCFRNGCALLPSYGEILALQDATPLTRANVQQYNDIAYYMSEFLLSDVKGERGVGSSCVTLLGDITRKFPDRAVAWLNLADVHWDMYINERYRELAADTYKKYLELMKAQGKDMNKVPARVYERMAKYKKG